MSNDYNGITVYAGILGVRHERGMYIGGTGVVSDKHAPRGLTQLLQEILSNSTDEYVVGYGGEIDVVIHPDNSMTVQDFGRGMPKGPGKSFSEVIKSATIPHASGKFTGSNYDTSGVAGMHGIGIKAANAVSRYFKVHATSASTKLVNDELVRDGGFEEYEITFNLETIIDSKIINKWSKREIEAIDESKNEVMSFKDLSTGAIHKRGTTITFLPDDGPVSEDDVQPVFESIKWVNEDLFRRLETSAFLNDGLKISFTDERVEEFDENTQTTSYLSKSWLYPNGIEDHVKDLAKDVQPLPSLSKPVSIKRSINIKDHVFGLQGAIMFTESILAEVDSYANGIYTSEGGPHEDGFNAALTKAINDFAKDQKLLKVKRGKSFVALSSFSQSDVLEGVVCAFEVRVPSDIATFESQTKEKLGTTLARQAVYDMIYEDFTAWLYDNVKKGEKIVQKVIESKTAKDAAVKARQEAKKARDAKGDQKLVVSGKLKNAHTKDPSKNEFYVVEGDSASNIGRDKSFQAVFPIRGKIKNAWSLKISEMLDNVEISTMASALGSGIGPTFDANDMLYDKFIIAADADADGGHIKSLLTALVFVAFPGMIEAGKLYAVVPPLYKATKYVKGKPQTKMFYSDRELNNAGIKGEGWTIQRFKGLGEMGTDAAREAIAAPETRRLERIVMSDAREARHVLNVLMGEDASLRKQWIEASVTFED